MKEMIPLSLISLCVALLLFLSIYFYKKVKNINNTDNSSKSKKYKKISLILFITYVILFLGTIIFFVLNSSALSVNKSYYDMYHNEYSSFEDVVYYTLSGEKYKKIPNEYYYAEIGNQNTKINARKCFLDEKGYFVILDSSKINYNESASDSDPYCFYDSNGNLYATATLSYWNENGDVVTIGQEDVKITK